MPRSNIGIIHAEQRDGTQLQRIQHGLAGGPEVHLKIDGQEFELPAAALDALRTSISYLVKGASIEVVPMDRELSTGEVASILGVSRQYVTKLIDRGEIPSISPHKHRRVTMADAIAYSHRRRKRRYVALDALIEQSGSSGAYKPPD